MNDTDFILKVKEFLSKSSSHYSDLISRKKRDLEIYSGNFWTDELKNEYNRTDRICKSFNLYSKFTNAILSPFSKSPWHAELEDPNGIYSEIQKQVDDIENKNNTKYVFNQAVKHAIIQGTGFFILSTVDGNLIPENVRDVSQIALDPCIQELDGKDAEAGAVVNYIAVKKAKRLYGDDVINSNGSYELMNFGDQWAYQSDEIPVVTYYEMNDAGTVNVTKLCGNKIVEDTITLNLSRIPIYRICFNEVVRSGKIDYTGIVDMTADLQFGLNLGYSTLLERANRSPKASYMMPAKALDGLDEFYKKLHTKESLVCLYNGDVAPQPIIEQYQTQDLMSTIQACNDLMSTTIGIPSDGINPVMNSQTATEILVQQNNSESNVNTLYDNANNAIWEFTTSLLELLCWENNIEKLPTFKLINGPQVITKMMKRRQELLAISSLVDEKTKKIIAKSYIDTLDAEIKEPLNADIIANSPEIQFISDSSADEDPRAIATLQRMNAVLNETQDQLEQITMRCGQLEQENKQLQLQLLNQKQDQILQMNKMNMDYDIKMKEIAMKEAETVTNIQTKQDSEQTKLATEEIKYQKEILDLEKQKLKIADEAMRGI